MSDEIPEAEPDDCPPDAATVASRALALCALTCRGFLEKGAGNADAEGVRDRIIEWVETLSLAGHLAAYELDAIRKPLGALTATKTSHLTWMAEGAAVLAWALGRGGLPRHDAQVDPYAVTDSLEFLSPDASEVVASADLRGGDEIRTYRELMYAIHCRVRDAFRNGHRKDFTTWIESRWLVALHIDAQQVIAGGDLSICGNPVCDVEKSSLPTFEAGIAEQHRASIWLVGESPTHWETTADT